MSREEYVQDIVISAKAGKDFDPVEWLEAQIKIETGETQCHWQPNRLVLVNPKDTDEWKLVLENQRLERTTILSNGVHTRDGFGIHFTEEKFSVDAVYRL